MDRPHLDWQQLSSTEFSHGAAKKEKFTRPTVSQSTGDLHFYPFCPSDESSSSPHHTVSGLWPKKTAFIIKRRRDLNVKTTVSWGKSWEVQSLLVPSPPISELSGARGHNSSAFDVLSHFVSNSTNERRRKNLLCHSVLLLILVDYMNTATETCSSFDCSFHKTLKCSSKEFKFSLATLRVFIMIWTEVVGYIFPL